MSCCKAVAGKPKLVSSLHVSWSSAEVELPNPPGLGMHLGLSLSYPSRMLGLYLQAGIAGRMREKQ